MNTWLLAIVIVYLPLVIGIKIRDRKLERRKAELQHRRDTERLDQAHRERMKIIEQMKRAELDEALEAIDQEIGELEQRVLGAEPRKEVEE